MLYREIIAVCSEILKEKERKKKKSLCGLNVELLNVKLVVHIVSIVSTGL